MKDLFFIFQIILFIIIFYSLVHIVFSAVTYKDTNEELLNNMKKYDKLQEKKKNERKS